MTTKQVKKRAVRELTGQEKETQARRQANLALLFEREGGKANLAAKLGFAPSYMSHWVNGRRPFTEKAARDVETKLGLEFGWMDNENSSTKELTIDAVTYAYEALEESGARLAATKKVEFVGLAYDLSMVLGVSAKDFINRVARLIK